MLSIKKILITGVIFTLFSCSSAPPFLSPSKTLVNTSVIQMGKNIPQKYDEFLNGENGRSKTLESGQRVSLGEYYTSALGQRCRILLVSGAIQEPSFSVKKSAVGRKRIVCKLTEKDRWVLIPAIVEQVNTRVIFAD